MSEYTKGMIHGMVIATVCLLIALTVAGVAI